MLSPAVGAVARKLAVAAEIAEDTHVSRASPDQQGDVISLSEHVTC